MDEPKPHTEICPRCEEGFLITVQTPQDITIEGSLVRIPNVRVDECRACGFRSLSGREVGLFEILFAPQYATDQRFDPGPPDRRLLRHVLDERTGRKPLSGSAPEIT